MTSNSSRSEVEYLKRKRTDGLQCPWNYLQILSWTLYIFLGITAFGFIIPLLSCSGRSASYVILGILFFSHFVFYILTISIDASSVDPNVLVSLMMEKKTKAMRMHCHLIPVTFYKDKTRFCFVCGKDVFNFDHHSKILNTCVGGRNFWFYLNCILTAFVGTFCLAIISLYVFHTNYNMPWVKVDLTNSWLLIPGKSTTEVKTLVILLISCFVGVLSLLIAVVLAARISFHLYVLARELSTPFGSKDLEAVHFSMASVTGKSQLFFCDTAIQTFIEVNSSTTQTYAKKKIVRETGSQTEKETRSPFSRIRNLILWQNPFKLPRRTPMTV